MLLLFYCIFCLITVLSPYFTVIAFSGHSCFSNLVWRMSIDHFEMEVSAADMVLELENLQSGHGGKLHYGYIKNLCIQSHIWSV